MAGLVPAIHGFFDERSYVRLGMVGAETWIAGRSPAMTEELKVEPDSYELKRNSERNRFLRKPCSAPPVGVVRLTMSTTLPSSRP